MQVHVPQRRHQRHVPGQRHQLCQNCAKLCCQIPCIRANQQVSRLVLVQNQCATSLACKRCVLTCLEHLGIHHLLRYDTAHVHWLNSCKLHQSPSAAKSLHAEQRQPRVHSNSALHWLHLQLHDALKSESATAVVAQQLAVTVQCRCNTQPSYVLSDWQRTYASCCSHAYAIAGKFCPIIQKVYRYYAS